ncbi:hypothetical protein GCM10011506_13650 [Marivirga lumbricoides]|uniref:Tetratricopeptide repeat protein n=1 Tax=Marivirga lumbricoides TaxID=1046115 RepID=A0ABQ1LWZ6_9BACT|nr:hypothetical protein GCM10011506_13650 [Marivirga lumbricoides]
MKRQILKSLVIIITLVAANYQAGAQTAKEVSYQAYLTNSEELWKLAIKKADNPWSKALACYGLLNFTMVAQNEELFDDYLDTTLDLLEESENDEKHKAEALALRASIYGFIMGYSPWKGMLYGPKSSSAINEALKLSKTSGIVWMVQGSSLFYTPESFGGDKAEAEKAFEKSIESYENNGDTLTHWLYLSALANLGRTYYANGKHNLAKATYEKALAIEPQYHWVSKVLLPQVKK